MPITIIVNTVTYQSLHYGRSNYRCRYQTTVSWESDIGTRAVCPEFFVLISRSGHQCRGGVEYRWFFTLLQMPISSAVQMSKTLGVLGVLY